MAADGILLSETAKKVAASGIGANQKRPPVCAPRGDRETSGNERLRRSFLDEKGRLRRGPETAEVVVARFRGNQAQPNVRPCKWFLSGKGRLRRQGSRKWPGSQ